MKKSFIKATLTLSTVLLMAMPTQAFATTKVSVSSDCNTQPVNNFSLNPQQLQNMFKSCQLNINLSQQLLICKDGAQWLKGFQFIKPSFADCLKNANTCTAQPIAPPAPTALPDSIAKPCKPATPEPAPTAPIKPNVPTKPTAPTKPTTPDPKPSTPVVPDSKPTTPTKPTTPDPTPSAPVTPTPAPTADIGEFQQKVVALVNKERAANGLSALTINTKLSGIATKKAEDLRDNNYFSHTSPTYGSPFDMMKKFGITYRAAGENIAMGQQTPESVMTDWMNSEGHKANILNENFTEIGVGYVTNGSGNTYWVQMFIKPLQ